MAGPEPFAKQALMAANTLRGQHLLGKPTLPRLENKRQLLFV